MRRKLKNINSLTHDHLNKKRTSFHLF